MTNTFGNIEEGYEWYKPQIYDNLGVEMDLNVQIYLPKSEDCVNQGDFVYERNDNNM